MKDQFTTKGFADYIIETRGTVNIFLDKIDNLINWKNIEKTLEKKYKKRASADGRPAYRDGIMDNAVRNKPSNFVQLVSNRLISSVRYKVERSIGTLKRGYHFYRMRYIGLKKGNMEFLLNAMAFNLKKAVLIVA